MKKFMLQPFIGYYSYYLITHELPMFFLPSSVDLKMNSSWPLEKGNLL